MRRLCHESFLPSASNSRTPLARSFGSNLSPTNFGFNPNSTNFGSDLGAESNLLVGDFSSNLPTMSPNMRRSVPTLAQGRHFNSSGSSGPPSRGSFVESSQQPLQWTSRNTRSRASSANSSALETAQIQLYLKKRDSRASLSSSFVGDNRPISAESKDEDSPIGVSNSANIVNLRPDVGNSRASRLITVHPVAQTESRGRSSVVSEPSTDSNSLKSGEESMAGSLVQSASLARQNTVPSIPSRLRTPYIGELVWQAFQVDETVYCGGLDAVLNMNMLCRLNIEYIVDLSGIDEDTMPRNRRGECPCLCSRRTAHSRVIMAINVLEEKPGQTYKQDLIPYFEDFVALIAKAKALKKCVLVHSHYGRNRAPAFTAAYLMHDRRCTRVQALLKINDSMSKMRPGLCISDTLQRALMRWQTVLGIRAADSGDATNERLSVPLFSIKRTAWT